MIETSSAVEILIFDKPQLHRNFNIGSIASNHLLANTSTKIKNICGESSSTLNKFIRCTYQK